MGSEPHLGSERRPLRPRLFARLGPGVSLGINAAAELVASFDGRTLRLGKFSPNILARIAEFSAGVALDAAGDPEIEREVTALVKRLGLYGLVEYRLTDAADNADLLVVEPQMRGYAPSLGFVDESRPLALSRFAYIRRRGGDMVLESPRAGALFRLCDARVLAFIPQLAQTRTLAELRDLPNFPGVEVLGLLLDAEILFTPGPGADKGPRAAEGDDGFVLWDFHDLLFHSRSTNGRHATPSGGLYTYSHLVPPLPAVRPAWPGAAVDLTPFDAAPSALGALLRARRSTRSYDPQNPIGLAEVAQILDRAARIISVRRLRDDFRNGAEFEIARRPYPSGGASYELELYLAVDKCEGLERGFYHYDAARHALVAIPTDERDLAAMLEDGQLAMGSPSSPQILVTMAARFGRVSWKYSGFAYALVLKDVGVLMQTLYLVAAEMEIGACAIGSGDIDLFSKMTGIAFHIEGAVGQMAIGRPFASRLDDD